MTALSREQIERLEESGASMPVSFTGVWKGVHYYKGFRWAGPTNRLGQGHCRHTDDGLVPTRGDD